MSTRSAINAWFTRPATDARRAVQWSAVALIAAGIIFIPSPPPAPPAARTYTITATSFAYAPAILRANPGDRLTLEIVSTDVVHGIYIDGYNLSVSADPGQTARLSFVADRAGTFRLRCSVTCGPLHPFMIGTLIVGPNWLAFRAIAMALLAGAVGLFGGRS